MQPKTRYVLISIDTEAFPKRATSEHVKRQMQGEHANGTAGVREMCAIADEVGAKLVFFVDPCGAYRCLPEVADVIRWLDGVGQDVQLNSHLDYLPPKFWTEHGFPYRLRFLNQYDAEKVLFTMRHFSAFLSGITGKAVDTFCAGSFHWNVDTILACMRSAYGLVIFTSKGKIFHQAVPASVMSAKYVFISFRRISRKIAPPKNAVFGSLRRFAARPAVPGG